MRATIKDVAAAAGVSIKTVSRVLNNERYVGATTRERVHAAVTSLGFRPSPVARALAGRRGATIALFYTDGGPHDPLALVGGAQARAAMHDARVLAVPCDPAALPVADAAAALLDATPVDGAVLLPPLADDAALHALLAERGVRTLSVAPGDPATMPAVLPHDAPAAAAVTGHLLALGHRRIGWAGGPMGDNVAGERARGHRAALAAAGIAADTALSVTGGYDFASGARAAAALLALADPPSAIAAASDTIAAGVLTAAHARGLRVPEDLSVTGIGDDPLAAYVWPPLTTARLSVRAIGEEAVDLLLGHADARREVGFELVERASAIGVGI